MSVTFASIRDRVKSGDIIALSHRKWNSFYDLQVQLVRIFTRSEYAHVGMVLLDHDGIHWVVESVTPHVRLKTLSSFVDEGFYWIPLNRPVSEIEEYQARLMVGTARYSKWEAVLGFFRKLKIGQNKAWECAEAVIYWRSLSGVKLGKLATPTGVVREAQRRYGAPVYMVGGCR